ncbi:MAG: hypothetical protein GY749_02130, partial [Desulfobacteraceae bacterium]|nr:hypothetical protein [Desulfobacteraceae bacterium]
MKKGPIKYLVTITYYLLFSFVTGSLLFTYSLADSKRPCRLPINQPEQITSEADPVLYAAISQNGKHMVYVSGREDFADLWLCSADPSHVELPEKLTSDPSEESWPAFSPDNRFIAYVGTSYDVKGDIFILNLKNKKAKPVRLTGRETEDGAPCFSHDGKTLYFHQAKLGDTHRQIVSLDLKKNAGNDLKPLTTVIEKNGAFPSISPSGTRIAFISFRHDPSGNIFVSDLQTNHTIQAT